MNIAVISTKAVPIIIDIGKQIIRMLIKLFKLKLKLLNEVFFFTKY
tara:strand:+ start:88 stop:225 length:138 start_codon:yes stop_codon:yes gene_type:complete